MLRSLKGVYKASAVGRGLGWGRPQIQGRARALSRAAATRVAWVFSSGSAKDCPASAADRWSSG